MAKSIEERRQQQREHKRLKRASDPDYRARENKRSKEYADSHREELKKYYTKFQKEQTIKYKNLVYDLFGRICVKCGYSKDVRALQIDHINGGGSKHRRKYSNYRLYKEILKEPDKYQVLCANCNRIKMYENQEVPGYGLEKYG